MKNSPFISIICPIYNEQKYIGACIESVVAQDFSKDNLEVLFVDGMSTDATRLIVKEYSEQHSYIRLLDNPKRIVPTALNIAISESKGDVIIRLDAHCVYPSNYISLLVDKLYGLNADNVGALCRTLPANDNSQSRAVAIVSSHRFGVGNSLFRVGTNKVTEVDTVPFGCFRADIFKKIGLFDTDLVRNQDDEFNARIIKSGGKIYLIPELIIDYYARDKIAKMSNMFYQYGLFKPLVNKKLGSPATLRQFFPLTFLLGIIFGGILSIFLKPIMYLYFFVLIIYTLLGLFFGLKSALAYKDWKLVFLLPLTFFVIHISYGWGYLRGITKFMILGADKAMVGVNR